MIPITLMQVLTQIYPNVQCYCQGSPDVYQNIVWVGGDPLPSEQQLNEGKLHLQKMCKIRELSEDCRQDIITGFESNALGTPHIYDSEEVDQINLVGAVSTTAPTPMEPTGYTIYYAVRNPNTNAKSYEPHTHFQLRQVLADGAQRKLFLLQKFATKRAYVEAATTIQEVLAITWNSNP